MNSIRVLIVDDSASVRRMLKDILSADETLDVEGVGDGQVALQRMEEWKPDVVTLDVEMPGMDGLATLVEIRKKHPRLPVIMFSALTERAAATTLEALSKGATDYVTKPSGTGSREASIAHVQQQLLPKIHVLGPRRLAHVKTKAIRETSVKTERAPRLEVVAIGASTGGPNALTEVFVHLPETFPLPVVITQHMPPVFTRMLAERLSKESSLRFVEAQGGEALLPGHVYVAPGDLHLRVVREGTTVKTLLDKAPPENSCRPSVDVLFRSVAEVFGDAALAVVLTGMGQDGVAGSRALREKGSSVLVQDEESSVVWGMPGAVFKANLATSVLPLRDIGGELVRRATRPFSVKTGVSRP